jgi:pimeloyl-ACP methyl ester carboxylesterase
MSVFVPVKGPEGLQVRTYAEVYGTEMGGTELKAACWVGGYTNIANGNIEFEVNKKWLVAAGVEAPLVLRQVAIYDADVHVPLSAVPEVKLDHVFVNVRRSAAAALARPTEEMLKGRRPAHLHPHVARQRRQGSNATLPSLLLLHGYCAKDNPWTRNNPVDFSQYISYEGFLDKSVLTNEYAQAVIQAHGHLPSWGLVGHSQGGLVALHLHNFYWSPNDAVATTGRPIQSMGTPWGGVSGTGAALDIGALFGVGCGDNFDLSTDGANLWQAGLQVAAKKDVWYYTTMWKKTFLHPRYCNLATNLVLDWPNDGMAEQVRAQLPEGHAVENPFEGECHTTDMKWPAQTSNVRRNKEINDNAAR